MNQLETIGQMIKAKRDREIEAAVSRIIEEVEKAGVIPGDLTQRIALEIQKVFDRHERLGR